MDEGMANQSQTDVATDVSTEQVSTVQSADNSEATTPSTEQQTAPAETPTTQTIKVKYNHEEKEIPFEEATTLIQKGLNYDKVQGTLQQMQEHPALKFVEKIAKENGMSTDELVQYWQQEQERREIEKLTAQGVPEELAIKLQRVDEYEQRLARADAEKQLQAKIDADLKEFMGAYPDLKPDEVPNEVWDLTKKGIPLLDAYNRVAFPKKLQELQQAQEVAKKNAENANKSPGSVTGQGAVPSDFISKSDFEANKGNRRWMIDNLSKIMQSRSKWGG